MIVDEPLQGRKYLNKSEGRMKREGRENEERKGRAKLEQEEQRRGR